MSTPDEIVQAALKQMGQAMAKARRTPGVEATAYSAADIKCLAEQAVGHRRQAEGLERILAEQDITLAELRIGDRDATV